jgi:hypothetical protein
VISVRGTVFDVVVEDDDGTTLVTVDEGVVTVRNSTAPGNMVQLQQGDFVRVFRGQPLMGKQIDKGNAMRMAMKAVRDAIWQIMVQRQGAIGPIPGGSAPGSGTQADKNGKTGDPGKTTGPGAPPAPPGTPPPPPGGH